MTRVEKKTDLISRGTRWLGFQVRRRIRKALRRPLMAAAFCKARRFEHRRRTVESRREALVLTTADPGNLGDEAVFWGLSRALREEHFKGISLVSFARDKL